MKNYIIQIFGCNIAGGLHRCELRIFCAK